MARVYVQYWTSDGGPLTINPHLYSWNLGLRQSQSAQCAPQGARVARKANATGLSPTATEHRAAYLPRLGLPFSYLQSQAGPPSPAILLPQLPGPARGRGLSARVAKHPVPTRAGRGPRPGAGAKSPREEPAGPDPGAPPEPSLFPGGGPEPTGPSATSNLWLHSHHGLPQPVPKRPSSPGRAFLTHCGPPQADIRQTHLHTHTHTPDGAAHAPRGALGGAGAPRPETTAPADRRRVPSDCAGRPGTPRPLSPTLASKGASAQALPLKPPPFDPVRRPLKSRDGWSHLLAIVGWAG